MKKEPLILVISLALHALVLAAWRLEADGVIYNDISVDQYSEVKRTVVLRRSMSEQTESESVHKDEVLVSNRRAVEKVVQEKEAQLLTQDVSEHSLVMTANEESRALSVPRAKTEALPQDDVTNTYEIKQEMHLKEGVVVDKRFSNTDEQDEQPYINPKREHFVAQPSPVEDSATESDDIDMAVVVNTDVLSPKSLNESPLDEVEQDYLDELRALIAQMKNYPKRAIRRRQEGVVWVEFKLDQQGFFEDIRLLESSGYSTLDKAALMTLSQIQKFKPVPKALALNSLNLSLPMHYVIR